VTQRLSLPDGIRGGANRWPANAEASVQVLVRARVSQGENSTNSVNAYSQGEREEKDAFEALEEARRQDQAGGNARQAPARVAPKSR
jgi:hypothetical protein